MTDETTTGVPQIDKALEEWTVDSWLDDATQAEDTVEIYNNGRLVYALLELTQFIENEAEKRQEEAANLRVMPKSIDEESGIDSEVLSQIEALREELHGTGLVFHIKGLSPVERDLLDKKVQRSLKAVKPTEDSPAIKGGVEHPDYRDKWTNTLVAACISKVVSPTGKEDLTPWTAERVNGLRKLPGVEFIRLSNAVYNAVFMTYEIEKLVDADFS